MSDSKRTSNTPALRHSLQLGVSLFRRVFSRLSPRVTIALVLFVSALIVVFLWAEHFRPTKGPPPKRIAFLGRHPVYSPTDLPSIRLMKDHDQFHFAALQYYIEKLESARGTDLFTLEYYTNNGDYTQSESFYDSVGRDGSVVLVVDNTWGEHIQPAADEIVRHRIPVIALNADKGSTDFNNQVTFLGADDDTPEVLVAFLTKVLNESEVTFITEDNYPLKDVFEGVFEQRGDIQVVKRVVLRGSKPPQDGVNNTINSLEPYLADDEARRRPILLNLHGDWGSRLVSELDDKYSDLTILAGGSAVNEIFDAESFGSEHPSNRFFVNYSAAEDVVSEVVRHDLTELQPSFREYVAARNASLFISRARDAATLIAAALKSQDEQRQKDENERFNGIRRRDGEALRQERLGQGAGQPTEEVPAEPKRVERVTSEDIEREETFLKYMAELAGACTATPDELLDFDLNLVRRKDVHFVLHQAQEANTYLEQLDRKREPIPNIRMGIQVANIFDIDMRTGDFGASFVYWIEEQESPLFSPVETNALGVASVQGIPDHSAERHAAAEWIAGAGRSGANPGATEPIFFRNLKDSRLTEDPVTLSSNGEQYTLHRMSGRFSAQFNMEDYPLDTQHLKIEVQVLNPSDFVRLSFDSESLRSTGIESGATRVDEWSIKDFYVTVDNEMGQALYGRRFPRECSHKFKHLTAHIVLERRVADALLTVVVPLILIGIVAIALLFVRDNSFHSVGNAAIGVFLGIMAFLIALTDIAPDLSQISRAGILFWSTFGVVIAVILVVVAGNSSFFGSRAQRGVLRVARIIIPVLYAVTVVLIPLM